MRGSVAWYRFRTTFPRRRGDYLLLVLLIGFMGGIAMGAVGAARRTQSSYPAFLNRTNASDVTMSTYGIGNGPQSAGATNYSPSTEAAIARVPGVKRVESWAAVFAVPLQPNGAPDLSLSNRLNLAGSESGLYFDEDRATPIAGRLPDPGRADEFMTTLLGAKLMGLHLNQTVPVGVYTAEQSTLPGVARPYDPGATAEARRRHRLHQLRDTEYRPAVSSAHPGGSSRHRHIPHAGWLHHPGRAHHHGYRIACT